MGVAAVTAAATGGSSALVPFVAGVAESVIGKEATDIAMEYSGIS